MLLRKYNKYVICRANPTEGNLQEMSIPMYRSNHKPIRRSDICVSWLWPLCVVRRYVNHKLCTSEIARKKDNKKNKTTTEKYSKKIDSLKLKNGFTQDKTMLLRLIFWDLCCIIQH